MRKLITILAMLAMASFGLVACGSGVDASENWRPIALLEGVVKNIPCDQRESADRQINAAIDEQNEDALSVLKLLTNDGKLDDGKVTEVRKDLGDLKATCTAQAVEATAADCPNSTPLKYDPNKDFNDVTGGIENTEDNLEAIKADPRLLNKWAVHLGFRDKNKGWQSFTTNDGKCLSQEGAIDFAKVEGVFTANTTKVEHGKANPNWYNTGMGANGPVVNQVAGIEGNLDAIIYTLHDGTIIVVLKRCGNLVLPAAPEHYTPVHIPGSRKPQPPGTGGPPPTTGNPPPTRSCPPGTTGEWPVCKDGVNRDPGNRGNAPQGGGQNRNPADPGTRAPYTPPPAATYTPPATQQPTVPQTVTPHETPRTTVPAPETGAPSPDNPGTGCIPAPGKSC